MLCIPDPAQTQVLQSILCRVPSSTRPTWPYLLKADTQDYQSCPYAELRNTRVSQQDLPHLADSIASAKSLQDQRSKSHLAVLGIFNYAGTLAPYCSHVKQTPRARKLGAKGSSLSVDTSHPKHSMNRPPIQSVPWTHPVRILAQCSNSRNGKSSYKEVAPNLGNFAKVLRRANNTVEPED